MLIRTNIVIEDSSTVKICQQLKTLNVCVGKLFGHEHEILVLIA